MVCRPPRVICPNPSTAGESSMYAFRTILPARSASYLILPTQFSGTPSREPLVVIHRGFITRR